MWHFPRVLDSGIGGGQADAQSQVQMECLIPRVVSWRIWKLLGRSANVASTANPRTSTLQLVL